MGQLLVLARNAGSNVFRVSMGELALRLKYRPNLVVGGHANRQTHAFSLLHEVSALAPAFELLGAQDTSVEQSTTHFSRVT